MLNEDCVWCFVNVKRPVVFTHVVGGRLKSTCCSTCWLIIAILASEETVSRIGGTVHAWYLLSFEVDLLFNSLARNPRSTSEESCVLSCSRLVSSAGVGGKLVAQLVCLLLQPHYDFRSSLLVVLLLNNSQLIQIKTKTILINTKIIKIQHIERSTTDEQVSSW